jgi:hypothetical protein
VEPYDQRVKLTDVQRSWIGIVAAVANGPVSLKLGYALHLMYAVLPSGIFFSCLVAVPFLTLIARSHRMKILTWQLAIASLTLTAIADNLRLGPVPRGEIITIAYVFWSMGILLSSPLPIYPLLRPLQRQQQKIAFIVIAAVALAMWVTFKRITG